MLTLKVSSHVTKQPFMSVIRDYGMLPGIALIFPAKP